MVKCNEQCTTKCIQHVNICVLKAWEGGCMKGEKVSTPLGKNGRGPRAQRHAQG